MRLFLLCCVFIFLYSDLASAQVLMRGPYLNMATQNSITIRWRTDVATNSEVKYGTNKNNLNLIAFNAAPVTDHIIVLNNLAADTKYWYSVGTTVAVLQGDSQNYFRTTPIPSATHDKPIRFWAVGDMAKNTPQEKAVIDAFEKHVDTNYVNGFILLGDNAYPLGYDEHYQAGFFDYYQKSVTKHTVLWPCLGNHDYANDYNRRVDHLVPYFQIFSNPENAEMGGIASNTERYYAYNVGNVHFINLDSYGLENVGGNYYGLADTAFSPQVQWLKYDLSLNTLPWVIVSYHHPPYCMGTHNSDVEADLISLRTNLNPILEKYNVDLVLNGHCHTYQRSNLIRNHFGLEATFDTVSHLVQNSSGRYDSSVNSCLYIKNNSSKKDSGVIYCVIGSGSAVPQLPFAQWPHNAMQYSNYQDNGGLVVTVEGNELRAEWISTDTMHIVKDQFTILKNANRIKQVYCSYPSLVTLKANWHRPAFHWSTGDTTRSINFLATHDMVLYVSDNWNCITDTFQILQAGALSIAQTNTPQLNVYPNPVNEQLTVDLPAPGSYVYTLYSPDGRILLKEITLADDKQLKIRVKDRAKPGQYFLSVKGDQGVFFSKITVCD